MTIFKERNGNYQSRSLVLGEERQKTVLGESIHLFTKQRLGALHNLLLRQVNLGKSEAVCRLARVLMHEPGPDCERLDGPPQPALHQINASEAMGDQSLDAPDQSSYL